MHHQPAHQPQHQHAFLRSTVLHKWSYVTPGQAAARIRAMHATCRGGPYLDCVLEFAEVSRLSRGFAELHRRPDIADPQAFLEHFELEEKKSEITP